MSAYWTRSCARRASLDHENKINFNSDQCRSGKRRFVLQNRCQLSIRVLTLPHVAVFLSFQICKKVTHSLPLVIESTMSNWSHLCILSNTWCSAFSHAFHWTCLPYLSMTRNAFAALYRHRALILKSASTFPLIITTLWKLSDFYSAVLYSIELLLLL